MSRTWCLVRTRPKAVAEYIYQTNDYALVLLDESHRDLFPDSNYGILNKEYQLIEAAVGVLYAGYTVMDELQKNLDEARPKPTPHLTTVQ